MRTLACYAALACLACVGGTAGSNPAQPTAGRVCTSEEFREAFLDGQQGVSIDDTRPSRSLVENADRFLPCLEEIANSGGATVGITGCAESTCQTWALWSIRLIGNSKARSFLVEYLATDAEPSALVAAIQGVGSLKEVVARPALRRLLNHKNPEVRLRSIVALGAIHNPEDLSAMLGATKSLPEGMMAGTVHGFRLLDDGSAIAKLQSVAAEMKDGAARDSFERALNSWRLAIASKERLLTTLRSGTGVETIKALQGIQEPVPPDVREAVFALLDNKDPHVRAESVVVAARTRRPADFEQLLQITLALPEAYVPIAARGLELLNDPRAIEPLQRYAVNMTNDTRKKTLLGIIERLRRSSETTSENHR